jgi:hypothetical protein
VAEGLIFTLRFPLAGVVWHPIFIARPPRILGLDRLVPSNFTSSASFLLLMRDRVFRIEILNTPLK